MTGHQIDQQFALVFSDAIASSGLTLEALQRRLAEQGLSVGRSTLSYWQNGRRVPTGPTSLTLVARLERILAVPDGTFVNALERPAPIPPGQHFEMITTGERVDRLIEEVGCREALLASDNVGNIVSGTLGPHGELATMRNKLAIRAVEDTDRAPFVHGGELGGDPRLIRVAVLSGGRLGRIGYDEAANIMVGEIIFDQQIRRGETHLFEYLITDPNPIPSDSYYQLLRTARTFMALDMTFHPECLPVRVQEFERLVDSGPDVVARNRMLGADYKVALVRDRARRGVVGLRWDFA